MPATASPLALPLSHPPVSGSSTSTPLTTNEGRRRTVGAVAHARRPHYSLSFSRFPLSHPPHLGLPMRGRRLTVGAVAHARRPHCSLSFSLFPLSQPPVSGSSTSTPWTTSSRSSTLSSLTLDLTPPSARSLNLASLRGGVCVYPLESEGSVRISFHFCFTAGGHSTHHQGVANEEPGGVVLKRTCPIFNGLVIAGTFA